MAKKIEFIPEQQRILVLADNTVERKTSTGIILPSTTQVEKPGFGTVIEVGSGTKDIPMRYEKGQRVMFSNYAGIEIELDYPGYGIRTFKVMNQMDVMGWIIEKGE